jgi:hypothetical protein
VLSEKNLTEVYGIIVNPDLTSTDAFSLRYKGSESKF